MYRNIITTSNPTKLNPGPKHTHTNFHKRKERREEGYMRWEWGEGGKRGQCVQRNEAIESRQPNLKDGLSTEVRRQPTYVLRKLGLRRSPRFLILHTCDNTLFFMPLYISLTVSFCDILFPSLIAKGLCVHESPAQMLTLPFASWPPLLLRN